MGNASDLSWSMGDDLGLHTDLRQHDGFCRGLGETPLPFLRHSGHFGIVSMTMRRIRAMLSQRERSALTHTFGVLE